MSIDLAFTEAANTYRGAMLDVIEMLTKVSPFAGVTLSCCAIDLLSHCIYDPRREDVEECYKKTVRKWVVGYDDEFLAQRIYDLRCGLVHEFRTGGHSGENTLLSDRFEGDPFNVKSDVIVSTTHFCHAVVAAFEVFFTRADDWQKRSFVRRAYLFIAEATLPPPRMALDPPRKFMLGTDTFCYSVPVSGSCVSGLYLPAEGELDAVEIIRVSRERGNWWK